MHKPSNNICSIYIIALCIKDFSFLSGLDLNHGPRLSTNNLTRNHYVMLLFSFNNSVKPSSKQSSFLVRNLSHYIECQILYFFLASLPPNIYEIHRICSWFIFASQQKLCPYHTSLIYNASVVLILTFFDKNQFALFLHLAELPLWQWFISFSIETKGSTTTFNMKMQLLPFNRKMVIYFIY